MDERVKGKGWKGWKGGRVERWKGERDRRRGFRFLAFIVVFIFHFQFSIFSCFAQYYDAGEDPAFIKWRKIDTKNFVLIYPSTLDSAAKRYAWLFDQATGNIAAPLDTRLKKIPVVLHAYNLNSNGLVSWAPKRMELMTSPPYDSYPQLWDKQLVLHETRHAAQMSKMGDHVVKYLHWAIGEQAEGLFVGIFIPGWYLEGDAVATETALSSTGRGRNAAFLMPQKAYLLNNMHFTWDQWKMGSYRYPVPGAYELGYSISAYASLKAGRQVFGQSLDYSTRRIYHIPPFDRALEKYAGGGEQELQAASFALLKQQWQREDSLRGQDIPAQALTPTSNDYTAYNSPVVAGEGRIFALRTTMNRTRHLVEIDSSGEVRVRRPMGTVNSRLVYHRGFIFWTEIVPHIRWPQQSYSVIKCYHPASGKLHTLTKDTRFAGVDISADGRQLVTIENTPEGESRLVVIPLSAPDAARPVLSPDAARYYPVPTGGNWQEAAWGEGKSGAALFATLLTDKGIQLYEIDPANRQYRLLFTPGYTEIKNLVRRNDQLIFGSGYNGRDNIYALTTNEAADTPPIYRLTNARFGAFAPTFDPSGATMVYSDYHAYGYRLMKIAADSLLWTAENFTQPYRHAYADSLSSIARFNLDSLTVPPAGSLPYESKPYHKATHLFRFHSWAPLYINTDEIQAMELNNLSNTLGLGATVFTQNSLNTAIGRLGYHYHNGGFHSGHLSFTYKGWYPVFDVKVDINDRYATATGYREDRNNTLRLVRMNIKDPYINSSLRMYFPFNFSSGGWQRGLILQLEGRLTNDRFYKLNDPVARYYYYAVGGVSWYERMYMGARELLPRWGYMLRAQYLSDPFGTGGIGDVGMVQLTTYSPGLFRNNGLQLKAGYQWQLVDDDDYFLSNLLPAPRGYFATGSKRMLALSADYKFPLFYPDYNLSWVVFFKRIQMNLFSDYTRISRYPATINGIARPPLHQWSVGADLLIDYHIFRFDFPVQTGVRYAQPITNNEGLKPQIELLFNMSFN